MVGYERRSYFIPISGYKREYHWHVLGGRVIRGRYQRWQPHKPSISSYFKWISLTKWRRRLHLPLLSSKTVISRFNSGVKQVLPLRVNIPIWGKGGRYRRILVRYYWVEVTWREKKTHGKNRRRFCEQRHQIKKRFWTQICRFGLTTKRPMVLSLD